jgi:hypothetical protein
MGKNGTLSTIFFAAAFGWSIAQGTDVPGRVEGSSFILIDPESGKPAASLEMENGIPTLKLIGKEGYRAVFKPTKFVIEPSERGNLLPQAAIECRPESGSVFFSGAIDGSLNSFVVGLSADSYFAQIGGGEVTPRAHISGSKPESVRD